MTGLTQEPVAASLTALQTLPAWLRAATDGERVGACLRGHEPDLAERRVTLLSCRADRLRLVGGQWQGRYELTVRDADGVLRDLVLAGRLWPPSSRATATVDESAARRFGEHGWRTWLPEMGLDLCVQSADEALPALRTLLDPASAARVSQAALRGAGRAGVTVASCRPRVARYLPGLRCTVVADVAYVGTSHRAPGHPLPRRLVLKTHRDDAGRRAWEAMSVLWERRPAWQDSVTLAEPLAYLEREHILVQGPVPRERTLKELTHAALDAHSPAVLARLRDELAGTARALAAVHRCGVSHLHSTSLDELLADLRARGVELARSLPEVVPAGEPVLCLVEELAHAAPPDPPVAAHNDFNPAQVLLDHGAVGLIDFDNACMAEPAMDVGRFGAKLRDIGAHTLARRGRPLPGGELDAVLALTDDLCEHFVACYREHAPISAARLRAWETYHQFTLLQHAWTRALDHRVGPRLAVLLHVLARSTA